MENMRGWPAVGVLVVLAILFLVGAALYATGNLQLLTSTGGVHIKHAAAFVGLAIVCLVGASFLRPRPTS